MKVSCQGMLVLAFCSVALCSCGGNWKTVELPAGTTQNDVLSIDLYAPFVRSTLLADPEGAYGEPRDIGSESTAKHYVFFKDYVGNHGRIRIYEEAYETDEGWDSGQWLELVPEGLYLHDIIKKQHLEHVNAADGKWILSLKPSDGTWYLTVELDGKAVTKVSDLPR